MKRPFYFRHQVQPFVVLFVERSGSTYLATALDAHPNILSLREQFATIRQQGGDAAAQLVWADEFWTSPLIGRIAARGFKAKYEDILDRDAFAELVSRKNVKVICLRRRNTVKGVVSTLNAARLWEKTGAWNLLNQSDRMPSFAIDPAQFHDMLQQRQLWDDEIERYTNHLGRPTLWLHYEEMLHDMDSFLSRVFGFIGVPPLPVQGRTYKHTKDELSQVILNFEELRNSYRGTPFEPMFDEVQG